MKLDDYAAVKYFRNNPDRNAVGIVTLIVGIIVFALYGIGNLLPDYDERVILLEDSWTSYPVSIYGLMYEGYDVKIEYDVLEGERVDMFILDEKNYMRIIEGQSYAKLFEIDSPTSGKEFTYTLIKDGPIYIIFHNTNTYSISFDVVITDLSTRIPGIFGLLLGIILTGIGLISLTGKKENDPNESAKRGSAHPNQKKTKQNLNHNEKLSKNERGKIIDELIKKGEISGDSYSERENKMKIRIAKKYAKGDQEAYNYIMKKFDEDGFNREKEPGKSLEEKKVEIAKKYAKQNPDLSLLEKAMKEQDRRKKEKDNIPLQKNPKESLENEEKIEKLKNRFDQITRATQDLAKLMELKEQGILSEEEFTKAFQKLKGKMDKGKKN